MNTWIPKNFKQQLLKIQTLIHKSNKNPTKFNIDLYDKTTQC